MACTCRAFCPEQITKKSVKRPSAPEVEHHEVERLLVARRLDRGLDLLRQAVGAAPRPSVSVLCSCKDSLPDRCSRRLRRYSRSAGAMCALDRRARTSPASGWPRRRARSDLGGRHVRRVRVDQENRACAALASAPGGSVRHLAHRAPARSGSASAAASNDCPGRETTTKCARSRTAGIVVPRRNFCERVGARDEEQAARPARPPRAAARKRHRRVTTGPGAAAPGRWRRSDPAGCQRPATTIAKRWNADARGCDARCGGRCDGMSRTSSSASAARRASAAARWPTWIGIERAAEHAECAPAVMRRVHRRTLARSSASVAGRPRVEPPRDDAARRFEQRRHALAGDGRDRGTAGSRQRRRRFAQALEPLGLVERIDLVGRHQSAAARSSLRLEQLQLAPDDVEVVHRVAARRRRHVDEVDQHLRALEVAEELVAEAVRRGARPRSGPARRPRRSCGRRSATTPRCGVSVVNG